MPKAVLSLHVAEPVLVGGLLPVRRRCLLECGATLQASHILSSWTAMHTLAQSSLHPETVQVFSCVHFCPSPMICFLKPLWYQPQPSTQKLNSAARAGQQNASAVHSMPQVRQRWMSKNKSFYLQGVSILCHVGELLQGGAKALQRQHEGTYSCVCEVQTYVNLPCHPCSLVHLPSTLQGTHCSHTTVLHSTNSHPLIWSHGLHDAGAHISAC